MLKMSPFINTSSLLKRLFNIGSLTSIYVQWDHLDTLVFAVKKIRRISPTHHSEWIVFKNMAPTVSVAVMARHTPSS
jgi:hypothetical protein